MELVTGRSGKPHITSQQVRQLQQGIFGENACILNTGSMLTPEVQSSNKNPYQRWRADVSGCSLYC